jgi:CotH kinase protein/Lamin Tail Domain
MFPRVAFATLVLATTSPLVAQDLFNPEVVHTVQIEFAEDNWDHLLDSMAQAYQGTGTGEGRLMGSVTINGQTFDSCGVRFKGNSTYNPQYEKNPLNIDLNEVLDQDYFGTDKVKLANGAEDPSMVREMTFYELAGRYMHAPRASYVKVWINGDYKGLYVNTEDVGNEFLDAHFGESEGACFKCDPVSIDVFTGNSNMSYHADSMAYDTLYDMQSDYGLQALQAGAYELEFATSTVQDHLDVDRALWYHALSNVLVHLDSYYAFAHNYYLYKDKNQRWNPILWDANMAFGGLLWDGQNILPLSAMQLARLPLFHMASSVDSRPLLARLLEIPTYERAYLAHYRTLREELLQNGLAAERATYWHGFVDSLMQYEPYSFYPYAQFQQNLNANVGSFFLLRPGLTSLLENRRLYVDTLSSLNTTAPEIQAIAHEPAVLAPYGTGTITCQVSSADVVELRTRESRFDRFVAQPLYDDGQHGDGDASDGTYGAQLALGATDVQYCIYAENASAGSFSPPRAEHEYHTLSVEPALVLNEAQVQNESTAQDQAGETDDWIELYNNSDSPVPLLGYHLSDDPGEPYKWAFPDTVIAPGSFLIVWADEDEEQMGLHANFKLSSSGESLLLSDAEGGLVNEVMLMPIAADSSYGRFPNGIGPWEQMQPTWDTWNSLALMQAEKIKAEGGKLYPVPSEGLFTLELNGPTIGHAEVFAVSGQWLSTFPITSGRAQVDLRNEPMGLYFVLAGGQVWPAAVVR